MTSVGRRWFWLAAAIILTGIKLWFTRGQGIFAIGNAGHDDLLFVQLAQQLINGNWLGPYNELTLAKGPFYSLFIAASFLIGVPLFLAQHTFYAAACALFAQSLKPAIKSAGARFTIYAVLLYNPMTYDMPGMGRVLRQQVYGSLALIMFAALIAMYLRRAELPRRLISWSLLFGLATGAFYLTREESSWILPSIVLLSGSYIFQAWRDSPNLGRRALRFIGFGLGIACLPIFTVSALNKHHYGWFGTCEFRASEFQDAYGALLRVQVGPNLPYVPVTREARETIARVSPKFAELLEQFDAGIAQGWAGASEFFTHLPADQEQIGGGWMIWALREAAVKAGHGNKPSQAMDFYASMAQEINDACDQGLLPARSYRSGFLPVWHQKDAAPFVHNLVVFTDFVARFSLFSARPPPSEGSPEQLQLFRDITHERLSPPTGQLDTVGAKRYVLNAWKVESLHRIGKSIRQAIPILFYLSLTVLMLRAAWTLWNRTWTFPLTVACAALGAVAASIVIHSLIQTTSFPVLSVTSFAPIYPLLLVFILAVAWELFSVWNQRRSPLFSFPNTAPTVNSATHQDRQSQSNLARRLSWCAGLCALLPFLIWYREFQDLFWFGDDFFLLDQIAQMGLLKWSTLVFSENFVPLFKVLWGIAVFWFGGSYLAMLWLLWLSHALNAFLFTRILQRAGFPFFVTLFCGLIFALSPVNIETLGWSVQWSAVLATNFLLIGLWWLEKKRDHLDGFSWRVHLPLFLFATASACSFSRGVLTGAVLALGFLLPVAISLAPRLILKKLPGVLLCLIPAVTVAIVIKMSSAGNHQHMTGHWGEILEFGASYFLLNPFHALLSNTALHPVTMMLIASAKVGIIFTALMMSRGRVLHVLLLLLAFDLGNAVLLGIGRYHTGFLAAMSSRYQYSSLIATLPFIGVLLSAALSRISAIKPRRWATVSVSVLVVGYCLWGWPATLEKFIDWRGTDLRRLLSEPATNDPKITVPTMEFMHIERAKALQRAYDLH